MPDKELEANVLLVVAAAAEPREGFLEDRGVDAYLFQEAGIEALIEVGHPFIGKELLSLIDVLELHEGVGLVTFGSEAGLFGIGDLPPAADQIQGNESSVGVLASQDQFGLGIGEAKLGVADEARVCSKK